MPKASPIQASFNRGIQSPTLAGNINVSSRDASYRDSQNLIPLEQGPVIRRGGTKHVQEVKNSDDPTVLVRFRRNSSEAYILEFGDLYVRFYKNNAPVTEVTKAITDITSNVLTFTAHGYLDDDQIILKLGSDKNLQDRQFIVDNKTANTFTLKDMRGVATTLTNASSPTTTVERIFTLASPYRKQDLCFPAGYDVHRSPSLDFVQQTDTLFITHPNYTMRSLRRVNNDTDWEFDVLNFKDGPYLPIDTSGITITLGLGTGSAVTCTASAPLFKPTDTFSDGVTGVARRIRFQDPTLPAVKDVWIWATIQDFTSSTVVEIDIQESGELADFTVINTFRLGIFHEGGTEIPGEPQFAISGATQANPVVLTVPSTHTLVATDYVVIRGVVGMVELNDNTYQVASVTSTTVTLDELDGTTLDGSGFTGYTSGGDVTQSWRNLPRIISLFEDRFCFSGTLSNPDRIDMTTTGGYSPALLRFDPTNPIDGVVTPENAPEIVLGGSEVNSVNWMKPLQRGLGVGTTGAEGLIQSSSQGERLNPSNVSYKQQTTNGSSFVKPFALGGALLYVQRSGKSVHEFGYSFEADSYKSPDMTLLAEHLVRDGVSEMAWQQEPNHVLWVRLGTGELLGFTYNRDEEVIAWHRHLLGGTDSGVKSMQVIPSGNNTDDELWMIVERTVDGNTVKYVEFLTNPYTDDMAQEDIYSMDGGREYSGDEFVVSGATQASPVVLTTGIHTLTAGEFVKVTDIVGMTELNGQTYKLGPVTATTMTLLNLVGTPLDGSAFTAYSSGGVATESLTTVTNLQHIEGQVVSVLADGKEQQPLTVTNGAITLTSPTSGAKLQVGLQTTWILSTLRLEAGSADGTAQGKIKRINKLAMRFKDTLGVRFGTIESNDEGILDTISFSYGEQLSTATSLFTGDFIAEVPGGYDRTGSLYFTSSGPFSVQIQALMPQVTTQDTI